MDRYSRQIPMVGVNGQRNLGKGKVGVVGVGAIGSAALEILARSGIGHFRIIDRDLVEPSNLHRQHLFQEEDLGEPKAIVAARRVRLINSEVGVDARVKDLNPDTALELLGDLDVIVDGTDNWETRFLINDFCWENATPWVHGAAIRSEGLFMPVVPGEGPCFRCLWENPPLNRETCFTSGITGAITTMVASLQSDWVLEFLAFGSKRKGYAIFFDLKGPEFRKVQLEKRPDCKTCARRDFEYLKGAAFHYAELLCGQDTVQILPKGPGRQLDLKEVTRRLRGRVEMRGASDLLRISLDCAEIIVFRDGRAFIRSSGITLEKARKIYHEVLG